MDASFCAAAFRPRLLLWLKGPKRTLLSQANTSFNMFAFKQDSRQWRILTFPLVLMACRVSLGPAWPPLAGCSQVSHEDQQLRRILLCFSSRQNVGETSFEVLLVWAAHQAEPSKKLSSSALHPIAILRGRSSDTLVWRREDEMLFRKTANSSQCVRAKTTTAGALMGNEASLGAS